MSDDLQGTATAPRTQGVLDSGERAAIERGITLFFTSMQKTEFIKYLARKHRRPQAYYALALDDITSGISEQLTRGKSVRLTGFGTFLTVDRKAGSVRSVRTGEAVAVPAHRRAYFRVDELLKRAVRKSK